MNARQAIVAALLPIAAACSHRVVVQTHERVVTVHDTVLYVPPRVWAHPLDSVTEAALGHFASFATRSSIGLCVTDLATGDTLAWKDGDTRLRTASVMKAVTAITALATVADTTTAFTTRVMTDGERLWLRGGYDPMTTKEEVERLAREAHAKAPRAMAVARAYSLLPKPVGEQAEPSGVQARRSGEQAERSGEQAGRSGEQAGRSRVTAAADEVHAAVAKAMAKRVEMPARLSCNTDGQDTKRYGRGWCWDDNNPLLTPLFYGPATQMRKRHPIERAEQDFMDAFNPTWRRAAASPAPTTAEVEAELQGMATDSVGIVASLCRPIGEVLRPMLKESDNLMAEAVWRLTGNTPEERAEALAAIARLAGVTGAEYQQADGSGLSLYNYFTPSALVKLLAWADGQPFAPMLREALPHMGVDGTLRNRRVRGARIEAKTGTVEGVITLAGYMTLINDRRLAFAVMMNGVPSKGEARTVTDYLLEKIAEGGQ